MDPLETNSSDISIKMQMFSFMEMQLKISPATRQPICPAFI